MSAQIIPLDHPGATAEEWTHFDLLLGLTADLLPVVSNPHATISPDSKMQAIGKTPSRYNRQRQVSGVAQWTQHVATPADIQRWSHERDYGICIQTRYVRALDVDIEDEETIRAILRGLGDFPRRERSNSNKFLVAFRLAGDFTKRILRTAHGAIEFLATGQQFIAAGTHPSGARYEWAGGLPDTIPALDAAQFEALWRELEARFAIEPSTERKTSTKSEVLVEAAQNDPLAQHLATNGWVRSTERDGRLHIRCPWQAEHTTASADSATTYFPAHTGGYERGTYFCMHAHCEHRTQREFHEAVGFSNPANDFDVVEPGEHAASGEAPRFQLVQAADFATQAPERWVIRDVLPEAELAVIYGESGSGKSFLSFDMVAAVSQGVPWRTFRTTKGRCVYVVAEGAKGFRKRVRAYAQVHGLDLAQLDLYVLGDAPNLMLVPDVKALIAAIRAVGEVSVVVIDTLARTMVGGNENAAEDVAKVTAHCAQITKHTGAMVMLVHHSGKDATKGARGSSALRAAADAEFEVVRADDARVVTVSKMKDGEDAAELGFRLQTVMVGVDEEGEEVTSCVVEHTQAVPRGQRKAAVKGADEQIVLNTLADLGGMACEPVAPGTLAAEASMRMAPPEEGGKDGRYGRAVRAFDRLVAGNRIVIEGGCARPA